VKATYVPFTDQGSRVLKRLDFVEEQESPHSSEFFKSVMEYGRPLDFRLHSRECFSRLFGSMKALKLFAAFTINFILRESTRFQSLEAKRAQNE
jgi:hypothetical protein